MFSLLIFLIPPIILGFLEIFLVEKIFNINMKYIKLLKIFELITPFIALINPQGTGKIAGNEFIINFIFYFLDVIFTFLSILLAILVIFWF